MTHYWDKSESHTIELLLDDGMTFAKNAEHQMHIDLKTKRKKRSDAVLQAVVIKDPYFKGLLFLKL